MRPKEISFLLHRTLKLSDGYEFYHEDIPKEQQCMTAIKSPNDKTIMVTLFYDRISDLLKETK